MTRPHLFIATPCYGGVVTQGYMQSVLRLVQNSTANSYDLSLGLLGQDALITRSRNTLLAHFMSLESTTHILYIDSDISFEADLPNRLLKTGKDVVAATYPLKTHYWDEHASRRLSSGEAPSTAALRYVGELLEGEAAEREGDLATARFVGTGFLMISRQAVEKLIAAFPETRYDLLHVYADPQTRGHQPHALFDCLIDPVSRAYLSEDFAFCQRWRSIGGKIWLDTRSQLTHTGPTDFEGFPIKMFEPGQTKKS